MSSAAPIVDVRQVSKMYRTGHWEVHALRGISFTVPPRSVLAVMGPSGSGKSTLLNLLGGLDYPTEGEIRVDGQRLDQLSADEATVFRRRNVGFVFQFFNLLPTMTAHDNVALPMLADRVKSRELEERAAEALAAVGLADRSHHRPHELSGGEMQRVAIARALVMCPRLLLADEPTGNLDTVTGDEVLALLRTAVERYGLSIVMVTHSHLAAATADHVLMLRDGQVVEALDPARLRNADPLLAWRAPLRGRT